MRLGGLDISAQIQLHKLRAGTSAPHCASCRRHPLPGEVVHVDDAGKALCTLCAGRLPEDERAPLRSERIHATHRQLAVVPRAA
jgi:hypothetical protein